MAIALWLSSNTRTGFFGAKFIDLNNMKRYSISRPMASSAMYSDSHERHAMGAVWVLGVRAVRGGGAAAGADAGQRAGAGEGGRAGGDAGGRAGRAHAVPVLPELRLRADAAARGAGVRACDAPRGRAPVPRLGAGAATTDGRLLELPEGRLLQFW
jgi:hypothetical protein